MELKDEVVNQTFDEVLSFLQDFVRLEFVSVNDNNPELMKKSASFVKSQFDELGFKTSLESAKISEEFGDSGKDGNLAIIGYLGASESGEINPEKPTILLYAHHDVQPAHNLAGWDTKPFEPTIIGERMFGRGAADDGAGIAAIIGGIKLLLQDYGTNLSALPANLKIYIEGEEEIGSPSFSNFVADYSDKLQADVIIIADSGNWAVGVPAITASLRGVATIDLELSVLKHSIHSGMSSGPIIDANSLLMKTIGTIWDDNGEIVVSGLKGAYNVETGDFGADYIEPSVDYSESEFRNDSAVLDGVELAGSGTISGRIWNKPSVTVIGFDATPVNMSSNVFAPSAKARLSLRIVPGQDPNEAAQALVKHLESNVPLKAHFKATILESGPAFAADINSPAAKVYAKALEEGFGKEVVYSGMGGSIPFTAVLSKEFPDAQILIAGVEDPDSRAHSDNESVHLGDLKKCIKSFYLLFKNIGQIK